MKSQSRKAKGRELQKHVARKIVEAFEELEEDDAVSRPMGSAGEDIMMSPLCKQLLPLSIECKNTKTFPSIAAIEQAAFDGKKGIPVVVWKPPRKSYEDAIIYFRLNDFLELWNGKDSSNS